MNIFKTSILTSTIFGIVAANTSFNINMLKNDDSYHNDASVYIRNNIPQIILAAARGNSEEVKKLLDKGEGVDTQNKVFDEIRQEALKHNIDEIEFDADLECYTTPLIAATMQGHIDVVKLLLERGANPNLAGTFSRIPLANAKSLAIVELLLQHGADPKILSGGSTPLHVQVCGDGVPDRDIPAVIHTLIKAGANVNACDCQGETVLDWFTNERVYSNNPVVAHIHKTLLECGAKKSTAMQKSEQKNLG